MGIPPSHSEPRDEIGSLSESIFPSPIIQKSGEMSIFKIIGKHSGRPRKHCIPISIDRVAAWNVEGLLGDNMVKLVEFHSYMLKNGISILCIQETHLFETTYFEEDGFLVFLSLEQVNLLGVLGLELVLLLLLGRLLPL